MPYRNDHVKNPETSCPVCFSNDIFLFMRGIYDSKTTSVLECRECGMQFLNPMMSSEEEDKYYEDYYEKQRSRHFNYMDMEDIQNRSISHYQQYKNIYLNLLNNKKNILEIGSGTGGFLSFLKNNYWDLDCYCIERCNANKEFIKNKLPDVVLKENIEDFSDNKFDIIVAFGVFEHIKNSDTFLSTIRNKLSGNGVLALNVPNKLNPLVYLYNLDEFKKFTYMKQHYYTFTEESLNLLAKRNGFLVNEFNFLQVWGLDNHLSWLRYREPRDFSDITTILSHETITAYNSSLISKKMTDLMMAVLVKK